MRWRGKKLAICLDIPSTVRMRGIGPGEVDIRSATGDQMNFDDLTALLETHGPLVRERLKISRTWRGAIELDDVMQVTFLEAFLHIDQFTSNGDEDAFGRWLLRIAQNNVRDAIKGLERAKRKPDGRRVESMHAVEDDSFCLEIAADSTSPSGRAARSEFGQELKEALQALPVDYRSVVERCDLDGLSIPHAANMLGRTPASIYMLRARAHDRLRDILGAGSRFFTDHVIAG
jgi:RNA polymerase sigma factor (sigma-70 family)